VFKFADLTAHGGLLDPVRNMTDRGADSAVGSDVVEELEEVDVHGRAPRACRGVSKKSIGGVNFIKSRSFSCSDILEHTG
jgi:hypothetical protein